MRGIPRAWPRLASTTCAPRIAGRYLAYAALASIAGAALGIAVLAQVLPVVVMYAYAIIYAVPQLPLPLPIDPVIALSSGGLGVGVTLVATLAAVGSALRETPAQLMQPRAPKAGRRILLERIRPLWRRLSFLRKVAARNLFRYKKRLFMTVIGISGCTALLLVGFGLHDAIWDIIDNQFGPIIHYNTTVTLIVSAAALAAVVLYNLTNINIGERVREIATLKVLGFKRREVSAYIFREVLILTLIGDVLGLVLGTWLEGYVIVTAEVDVVMFGRVIHPASYVYAFVLTLVFSALVMLVMRRKLDRIDMVESLKSVD